MTGKKKKPDKREYTLMLVPHQGQSVRSIRIPIKAIKFGASVLGLAVVMTVGAMINYQHTVTVASKDKAELEHLRQTNGTQVQQIEQLAKSTATLQADMERLNNLDSEVRRILNNEDHTGTSRSGVERPSQGNNGQGGPQVQPTIQDLTSLVQNLQQQAKAREESLAELKEELLAKQARAAATPSIWPTGGDVTSRFGWRSSPWGWGSDWHPGIDIANSYGTPIVATADGVVVQSEWYGGYGKMIQIDHGNGMATVYGHNSQMLVSAGEHVKKGQVIAYMGSTGASTGNHLHYEVRVNGTAVNPASFLN